MINIVDFSLEHIEKAQELAHVNYNEERVFVPELPVVEMLPNLAAFADNGLGAAAFDNGEMVGFLCCYKPWDNAFKSTARGTFSPIHAHGAVKENRAMIYKRLYEAAAKKWVEAKISSHAIALYAHDNEAIDALFSYGFGLRCIDAIRPMEAIEAKPCEVIDYRKLPKIDSAEITILRSFMWEHMGKSPCFMYYPPSDFDNWLANADKRNSQIFIACDSNQPVAFMEIAETGETFATKADDMLNICGAFCFPEFRGKGIYQNLLNYAISALKSEGYARLGVDFESINPTAMGFWSKYFTPYTKSVVRRIDENALGMD